MRQRESEQAAIEAAAEADREGQPPSRAFRKISLCPTGLLRVVCSFAAFAPSAVLLLFVPKGFTACDPAREAMGTTAQTGAVESPSDSTLAQESTSLHIVGPWHTGLRWLPLRITEEELIVYGSDLEVLARHRVWPRSTTGQRSELPEHRPQEDGKQREAHLRQCFAELGPAASRFLEGLLKTHRMGKDQASRVLALLETYRKTDVANALERAARFGAFSLRAVERILAAQAQPEDTAGILGRPTAAAPG
ncbi:MAG: hypothetical protein M5U12_22140 [Verrucomicrobia bacterium]|nr:hypothetical protein [Verrucomicrobiota bacterium]